MYAEYLRELKSLVGARQNELLHGKNGLRSNGEGTVPRSWIPRPPGLSVELQGHGNSQYRTKEENQGFWGKVRLISQQSQNLAVPESLANRNRGGISLLVQLLSSGIGRNKALPAGTGLIDI